MPESDGSIRKIQVRSFNYKWYEFLITYGIFNLFCFYNINTAISNIYKNFSELYVSNFTIDGSDFSIFANLLAAPIIAFLTAANIGIILFEEVIIIIVFRYVYFRSQVKYEEMDRLEKYIEIALILFALASLIGMVFWGGLKRSIIFIFLYLPVPILTFLFFCIKMKRLINHEKK